MNPAIRKQFKRLRMSKVRRHQGHTVFHDDGLNWAIKIHPVTHHWIAYGLPTPDDKAGWEEVKRIGQYRSERIAAGRSLTSLAKCLSQINPDES